MSLGAIACEPGKSNPRTIDAENITGPCMEPACPTQRGLPGIGTCQVEVRDTPEQEENVKIEQCRFHLCPWEVVHGQED